jgi:hypothetical protein
MAVSNMECSVSSLVVLVHVFGFFQLQSKVAFKTIMDKVLHEHGAAAQA